MRLEIPILFVLILIPRFNAYSQNSTLKSDDKKIKRESRTEIKDNHGLINNGNINGPVTINNNVSNEDNDDTVKYLSKFEMKSIGVNHLEDTSYTAEACDHYYLKYSIQNRLQFPVNVTFKVPFGYYRDCIPYKENFVTGGHWSITKFIPGNESAYFIIKEKLDSKIKTGVCSGVSNYIVKAVSLKRNADSSKYIGEDLSVFYYLEAMELYQIQQYKEAVDLFTKSLNINKTESIYHLRGECYLYLFQFREAIQDLENSIRIWQDKPEVRFLLGLAYYGMAITESESAAILHVSSKPKYLMSAFSNFNHIQNKESDQFEASQIMLLKVLDKAWEEPSARYMVTDDKIETITQRILQKNNRNAEAFYFQALFGNRFHHKLSAIEASIDKAMELDPNNLTFKSFAAQINKKRNR